MHEWFPSGSPHVRMVPPLREWSPPCANGSPEWFPSGSPHARMVPPVREWSPPCVKGPPHARMVPLMYEWFSGAGGSPAHRRCPAQLRGMCAAPFRGLACCVVGLRPPSQPCSTFGMTWTHSVQA